MAFNALDFPVDVQWRLLATSQDMFASSIDASFPAKWKSSLAVYFFEPEADPDSGLDDPTLKTVFLKVVATITGYVYDGPEIDPMSFAGDYLLTVYKNFTDLTALYFPALAALVQVGIFPKGTQADGTPWPLSQYPWFTDFEPKKREVIELASDTGEVLTQSATNMSVRKGVTGTDSQENVNIDHGFSFSQAGQAAGFGGTTAGDIRRDVGSRRFRRYAHRALLPLRMRPRRLDVPVPGRVRPRSSS